MSETTEAPVAEEPVDNAAPVEAEATQPTEQAETQPEGAEAEQAEDPKPKVNRGDRRFANLTARTATLEQELAEQRRRAEAAEALLHANKSDDPPARQAPIESVEQAARRLLEQDHFNARLTEIDTAGKVLDGWEDAKATMTSLGATNNQAFLEALAATPGAERVFAELADDTDTLTSLLKKTPVAMAAEMGRMAAKIESKAVPVKPLSSAPRPIAPVSPSANKEPDIYDPNTSMKEYVALREKSAPRRLGGRG